MANAYHLAEQLLASQRRFAEDLVKATAPLRSGYRDSSPEVPSRSAWQDAVTDSEPKTPAVSAAPKAVTSTEPKAADSTPARTAPRTTAAKADDRWIPAEHDGHERAEERDGYQCPEGARRRIWSGTSAGTTTPAPKGTDKS